MPKTWTQNQQNAISARGGSLLVSAAAGSGKTAVLVERVIERITDPDCPVDADRLLVVTFTRAAAAEMKERIAARLDALVENDPLNSALRRQQLLLTKAHISTIHSFCSDLVRENFYSLDISADFRLAEENELALLKNETLNRVLETLYEDGNEAFYLFADYFSTAKSDYMLQQVILKLYEFLCAHPFPEKWLREKERMYDCAQDVIHTEWGRVISDYTKNAAQFCLELAQSSLTAFSERPELGDKLESLLKLDLKYMEKLCAAVQDAPWDALRACLYSFDSSARFTSAKGYKDDPQKLRIQANRDLLKKTLKSLCALFEQDEAQCIEDIRALSPLVHELFRAVRAFAGEYAKEKQEKNLADFNDLEHWTLALLTEETADGWRFTDEAQAIAARFEEVMVDEYQDANEIQDLIFRAVSGDAKRLFVVGDVKQSIYGFRQAMPEIFLRRKDNCPIYDPAADRYPAKVILDKNFRSRRGVTDAVNFVFRRLMSKDTGDMEYTAEEELSAGAQYGADDTPDMYFHLLDCSGTDEDTDVLEARHIAGIIKQFMTERTVTENGAERPARYGDFCIMLRSASTHANAYVKELSSCGVPASSEASDSFLSAQEVAVTLSYLRIIDNPLQDIPLLNVLVSPLCGFSPDDLAMMRADHPEGNLYFALKQYAGSGNLPAKEFLLELDELRTLSAMTPIDLLINMIYTRTGYPAVVRSMEGGELKLNNLRLLQEYAKQYGNSGGKGLSGFVRYIDRLEEQNCDLKSGSTLSEESDSVKVMTIHRSKGLEFPFCFLAATARSFRSDKSDEVLLHAELGLGIRRKDLEHMCRYSTMPREAVALEIEREGKSEELRVLYVAMTRAREKLIVLSSHKNPARYLQTMASRLTGTGAVSPYIVRGAGCISNWITQCALMHPDGFKLRELAGMPRITECESCLPWEIMVADAACGSQEESTAGLETGLHKEETGCTAEELRRITERLGARYPHSPLTKIPVKVAASELAHEENRESYAFASHPAFLNKDKLTGAEKGTALHAFMQYADLTACAASPEAEKKRLVEQGFLTGRQAQSVDLEKVKNCLQSSIMRRFLGAERQYREYRFTVKIKAGLADKELKPPYDQEDIVLQGAVDCAFEEDGRIVIVDYKTDRIKNMSELRERYRTQLELYRDAMQKCTGLPVKECVLYSFCLDASIVV